MLVEICFLALTKVILINAAVLGPKLRECEGQMNYKRLTDEITPEDDTTFYMNSSASNERECVFMCYERLQFCYSVKFVPNSNDPTTNGVCHFGYFSGDCTVKATNGHLTDPFVQKPTVLGCIKCDVAKPSFVQDISETNRIGSDVFVNGHTSDDIPDIKPTSTSTVPPSTTFGPDASTNLAYREYKTLNYLLADCNKNLTFSMTPTLLVSYPTIFTAISDSANVRDCATLCYRQQFCVSAIWRDRECLLSYQRGLCSDKQLPSGYVSSVLISCIRCR